MAENTSDTADIKDPDETAHIWQKRRRGGQSCGDAVTMFRDMMTDPACQQRLFVGWTRITGNREQYYTVEGMDNLRRSFLFLSIKCCPLTRLGKV